VTRLNFPKRIVVVVGLGVGFAFFGQWATTRGFGCWVADAH
jgi:hypothetical protein